MVLSCPLVNVCFCLRQEERGEKERERKVKKVLSIDGEGVCDLEEKA
jgi:hypothetical protein